MNQEGPVEILQAVVLTPIATTHEQNVKINLVRYQNQMLVQKVIPLQQPQSVRKEYLQYQSQIDRLNWEKQALSELNHPSINKLVATAKDPEHLHFFLTFERGIPLHRLLQNVQYLDERFTCLIMIQLALIFDYIHSAGWVYRDIKASNLIVNEKFLVRVIDFGMAKKIEKNRTTSFAGTLHSMAPEILKGQEHDYSVDYYGLGILFYELLTGKPPFGYVGDDLKDSILKGADHQMLERVKNPKLRLVIENLLELDPKKRMDCKELAQKIPYFQAEAVALELGSEESDMSFFYQNGLYEEEIYLYCTQFQFDQEDEEVVVEEGNPAQAQAQAQAQNQSQSQGPAQAGHDFTF